MSSIFRSLGGQPPPPRGKSAKGIPCSENAVSDSLSESREDSLEKTYFRNSLLSILLAMLVMIFLFCHYFFYCCQGC